MPGTVANPVRLDFLQRIVSVGWGAKADVLAFTFTITQTSLNTRAGHVYTRLRDLSHLVTKFDPWTQFSNLRTGAGAAPPIVVGAWSPAMLRDYRLFAYPPIIAQPPDTTDTFETEIIDLAHFSGFVRGGAGALYGGDYATAEEAYAAFRDAFIADIGRPPDDGELTVALAYIITSHMETVTRTFHTDTLKALWFLNLTRFRSEYGMGPTDSLSWKLTLPPQNSQPSLRGFSWALDVSSYRTRKIFARTSANAIVLPATLRLGQKTLSGTTGSDFPQGWNIQGAVALGSLAVTATATNNRTETGD